MTLTKPTARLMTTTTIDKKPLISDIVIGKKFGRLTITSGIIKEKIKSPKSGRTYYKYFVMVKCECGTEKKVNSGGILRDGIVSCGCFGNEMRLKASTTHGWKHTSEYDIWCLMKARCYKEKSTSFKNYGAKGVKVCDRWISSFSNFINDMGSRPSKEHSLDRYPNKNGNYEPSNCRWATRFQQCNNKNFNIIIEMDGLSMTFTEWCGRLNVPESRTYMRIYRLGWDIERAFRTPKINNKTKKPEDAEAK